MPIIHKLNVCVKLFRINNGKKARVFILDTYNKQKDQDKLHCFQDKYDSGSMMFLEIPSNWPIHIQIGYILANVVDQVSGKPEEFTISNVGHKFYLRQQ